MDNRLRGAYRQYGQTIDTLLKTCEGQTNHMCKLYFISAINSIREQFYKDYRKYVDGYVLIHPALLIGSQAKLNEAMGKYSDAVKAEGHYAANSKLAEDCIKIIKFIRDEEVLDFPWNTVNGRMEVADEHDDDDRDLELFVNINNKLNQRLEGKS